MDVCLSFQFFNISITLTVDTKVNIGLKLYRFTWHLPFPCFFVMLFRPSVSFSTEHPSLPRVYS